ncbi:MAG TPA: ATP-dependent metalloprotease, partial [Thermoplasmata archaeon]|nr:ATP-dependent metalloprotease [Thermoplasmata archaeon]
EHDAVYKVSIMPRGQALGVTMYLPEEDSYSYSKQKLESQLSSLYGGRIAEEMVFGSDAVTTGASNDIMRATDIAKSMVTKWGMSEKLGPLLYEEEDNGSLMGTSRNANVSNEISKEIDLEMRVFIDKNYQRAETILKEKESVLHAMADALMKYETIDADQVKNLMAGKESGQPKEWDEISNNTDDSNDDASTDVEMTESDLSGDVEETTGQTELH